METLMTKRLCALLLAAFLAVGTVGCNDNTEDNRDEAGDQRNEAADEAAEGDASGAQENVEDAARFDSAAARDSAQGDNTEGIN
jgi:hypothetical protein